MPTAKKEATIEELRKRLGDSKHLFFTSYQGLTVEDVTRLRGALRPDGSTYAVVKNTLFAIAAGDELAAQLEQVLKGPTGVVFTGDDPVGPAKALQSFSDDVRPLELKAGLVDGKLVDASQVKALASIAPRAELQAKVLGLFVSPLRGFVGVVAANRGGFVRVLNARAQQMGEGESPAPAA
jgi:large subunit ribosomal protein L10